MGSILGLLALAPLIGLSFLSFARINEASQNSAELGAIGRETAQLVELVNLQAALQNESFWSRTAFALNERGVLSESTALVLGTDVQAEFDASIEQTDLILLDVDDPDLTEAVRLARAESADNERRIGPLDLLANTMVSPAVEEASTRVISMAADQSDGSELVIFAENLRQSNAVRSKFSDLRSLFLATFGAQSEEVRQETVRLLAGALAVYESQFTELERVASPNPLLVEALDQFTADLDRRRILDAIDAVAQGATETTTAPDEFSTDSSAGVLVASNFTRATQVTNDHLEVVELSATSLTDLVEQERQDASRTAAFGLVATAAVGILAIGAIVAATRWIVRPLSDLGRTALALSLGGESDLRPASGPREIRLIHDALTEAITNLERTEQQAIALAEGELDDPSLDQLVPGRFGATLHGAIEQLRDSISMQEEVSGQLAYEAGHDGLTGLANRRASIDALTDALADDTSDAHDGDQSQVTVFFIDLDHFKEVNDNHGHATGDRVLRTVADALRSCARSADLVGRIGGDEFLVISAAPLSAEAATSIGHRFLDAIKDSLDDSAPIGASIGVAMAPPGSDVDALLAEADIAMLEAKKTGRNAVRFFDVELRSRTLDELSLSTNIRVGLEIGEFQLHYQPIVDSVSGRVIDYEALIRWDRPGVGRVPPDDYIPFAERSDLVIAIDRWVLNEAARTIAANSLDGVGIAVNISGRHLANGDLYGDLLDVLSHTRINPRSLTIEITESALLGDVGGAIETLRKIRETGVKVAIDDFGTGFTSLTHLRRLPADVLKIDQSFTSNLDNSDDANLVRLVIQTAHILRLDVVVEGVETRQQAQRVTMLGADHMQGYYFSKPKSLEQIQAEPFESPDLTKPPTSSHH